jgi:membrane-associated phospholipid phosphatase
LHGLARPDGSSVRWIAAIVAKSANPLPFAILAAAVVLSGFAIGRQSEALAAAGLILVAAGGAEVLKHVLAHTRYHPILGIYQIGAPAYPSGHATAAMALSLAAVLVAPPPWRRQAALGGGVYAIAVCTSLLLLGLHYPSDVFGGMLYASLCFCVAVAVLRAGGVAPAAAPRGARPSAWIYVGLITAAGAFAIALASAGSIASYVEQSTTATATALAIAGCSVVLVAGAVALADR